VPEKLHWPPSLAQYVHDELTCALAYPPLRKRIALIVKTTITLMVRLRGWFNQARIRNGNAKKIMKFTPSFLTVVHVDSKADPPPLQRSSDHKLDTVL